MTESPRSAEIYGMRIETFTTPADTTATGDTNGRPWRGRLRAGVFTALCVLVALIAPLPYLTQPLTELAKNATGLASNYVHRAEVFQVGLVVHAAAGGLALLLTPLQLWRGLRRRRPLAHRAVGWVITVAILVAAVGGLLIAPVSKAGLTGTVGFSMLALIWAFSAIQAVRAAASGRLVEHREWVWRTVALTFAAVTLRLWLGLLIGVQMPGSQAEAAAAFSRAYQPQPFLCWVPNLLVVEWLVRRRRTRVQAAKRGV
jgi:uncharacterized membrane protein